MLTLSCSHSVKELIDTYFISLGTWYVDQEGFKPCIDYKLFCKECYEKALASPDLIVLLTAEDEEEYLLCPENFPKIK